MTCDPSQANSSLQPTTNDANAFWVPVPVAVVVSQVWVSVVTAGITLTAAQNLITLHDRLGNLLATTPDQSAAWLSGGNMAASLGGSFTLVPPGMWVQVLSVGTTTPVFRSGASSPSDNLGPLATLRSQRVALGAISLGSFNPATSVTARNLQLVGLS